MPPNRETIYRQFDFRTFQKLKTCLPRVVSGLTPGVSDSQTGNNSGFAEGSPEVLRLRLQKSTKDEVMH
ncbi:MAG: hypothetical protein ACI814_004328, partial [Mariniblastus sp.]